MPFLTWVCQLSSGTGTTRALVCVSSISACASS